MILRNIVLIIAMLTSLISYSQNELNFGSLAKLIKTIENPILLKQGKSRVLVSSYQSQIITSSANGDDGYSYGWLDPKVIQKNKAEKTTFFYGGEDRFWLNPLGSKYSLFYGQNKIIQKNWKVPDLFLKEIFTKIDETSNSVTFKKENTTIVNNKGGDWSEEKGLITPWTIGMFKGTSTSIGIFPYHNKLSSLKLSTYFFSPTENRHTISNEAVYFKTDGAKRSKIGLKAGHCRPIIGNYDYQHNRLTIIQYTFVPNRNFLSSDEESLAIPYEGDVVNSYNNAKSDGKSTFFELETTAPGTILKKNEAINHTHRTFHFEGDQKALNVISKSVLGCDLSKLEFIFK